MLLNTIQILAFTTEYVVMEHLEEKSNCDILIATAYEDEGEKDPLVIAFIESDYLIFCLN